MVRAHVLGALLGLVCGLQLAGLPARRGKVAGPSAGADLPRRGVSLAGAEFGTQREDFCNECPGVYGRDYSYPHEPLVRKFCERGVRLLRLPVRWERLQPRLREGLDEKELGRLKKVLGWARKHGGEVILDVHNYGRYVLRHRGQIVEAVIDHPVGGTVLVSRDDFADLWSRLSEALAGEPAMHAYGLMNEPHDMGRGDWKAISQAAVDAIRRRGDGKLILVSGDNWSHAHRFAEVNGPRAWVNDPAGNLAYEAHCYFDGDHSGRYELSYEQELARDPRLEARGLARVQPFVGWCKANGVRGFIGEYGAPAEGPRWREAQAAFLQALDKAGMESCAWAAGEWWGNYRLLASPEVLAR